MDELRERLTPLTEWIPEPYRDYLPVEAWGLVILVAALASLVLVGYFLRSLLGGMWRAMVGRRRSDWDKGEQIELGALPAANGAPGLSVYHVPAWVRLVVVTPVGRASRIDPADVPGLLERVLPGLGATALRDGADMRAWPPALSSLGFQNSFHRCTPTGSDAGEASGWVLLAGRAQAGAEPVFLGVGLWASESTTLGRINLEPLQWRDVLRLTVTGAR